LGTAKVKKNVYDKINIYEKKLISLPNAKKVITGDDRKQGTAFAEWS
jgi:hypothetical protein